MVGWYQCSIFFVVVVGVDFQVKRRGYEKKKKMLKSLDFCLVVARAAWHDRDTPLGRLGNPLPLPSATAVCPTHKYKAVATLNPLGGIDYFSPLWC